MVRTDFKVTGSDDCHANELLSPFGARLSRRRRLLSPRRAMKAVNKSKQELTLGRALISEMLEHSVDVDDTKLSECGAGHSHERSMVLVLLCS